MKKIHFTINERTTNVDVFSSFLAAHSSICVLKITEELKKTDFSKMSSYLIFNLFIGKNEYL